jgi:oligopeptide/dipeptide ABC transporter ATP-binding protein|tara:strand:+ start:204 stop:1187 length:984 start_codon:yes stop_codon:yes gene_type:complete
MDKLFEIKNLKTFFHTEAGTVKAVNDVSFDIYKGEVLGIVGESGSGKSVTSLSINRLIPNPPGEIVSGKIIYDGKNLLDLTYEEMREYRGRHISMIFQEPMTSLNPVLRVGVQMNEVLAEHDGISEEEATKKSIRMLDAVGIPEPERRINDYPHQFSGGMRQRIMIAMALQCNPSLLIADEPTTALDVTIQAQILDLMMELKDSRNDAAILLITHDLAVIAETCDRVIVMYGGVIQEIATIDELFKNPLHPYTKALMESIPKIDKKSKRLKALKGMVPSILELGDGCKLCSRFEPEECACGGTKVEPELTEVEKGHFARINTEMLKS